MTDPLEPGLNRRFRERLTAGGAFRACGHCTAASPELELGIVRQPASRSATASDSRQVMCRPTFTARKRRSDYGCGRAARGWKTRGFGDFCPRSVSVCKMTGGRVPATTDEVSGPGCAVSTRCANRSGCDFGRLRAFRSAEA